MGAEYAMGTGTNSTESAMITQKQDTVPIFGISTPLYPQFHIRLIFTLGSGYH
jgi:hypothetical protein